MQAILDRITTRRNELRLSESAVAAQGGSRDLIRNWRRALEKGQAISARYDSLVLIAKALRVSEDWLIHGKEAAPDPQRIQEGLAETASPFVMSRHPTKADDPHSALRSVFGPAATSPALFKVNLDLPGFALMRGDVMLADLARLPEPGELAIVQINDDYTASAVTQVRRYLPPFLVSGELTGTDTLMRINDPGVTARHPVVGSIRGLPSH